MIEKDFKTAISLQFPSGGTSETSVSNKSSLDAEISLHHGYAVNKARFFVGREKVFSFLISIGIMSNIVHFTAPLVAGRMYLFFL
jgi:hypothetical protein